MPPTLVKPRFLPPVGTARYYILLASVALLILGPLGGITAAYMNFALGTFVGGQVLAGILGSVVTLPYGPDGKHGANYVQTMAASVASMSAMSVLIQAMVWLGMPQPAAWKLILYFLCIGMFGVGVGMLYTPILVDRMKLTYPSGLAVANILRALTDPKILKRSVSTLGGGIAGGAGLSFLVHKVPVLARAGLEVASVGGGMIVGARIALSAVFIATLGVFVTPLLVEHGYLNPGDPFRKIGFIFALGTILGAAVFDMSTLARDARRRVHEVRRQKAELSAEPKANIGRLGLWVGFWAVALVIVASQVLHVSMAWIAFAIVMSFLFQMINGISQGITDQNPISSAFVVTVLVMALLGLRDPLIGLFAGSVLLVSCTVGVDMQQDRSTGWRLGSNRNIQFRFQVIGIVMGALLAVFMCRMFLGAFPELTVNTFENPGAAGKWQSAMTYKFVGVLKTLSEDKTKTLAVMGIGVVIGFAINVVRKVWMQSPRYLAWKERTAANGVVDFILDAIILASPYASSFGGFVDFETAVWWSLGGVVSSAINGHFALWRARNHKPQATSPEVSTAEGHPPEGELPEDMSPTSLIGGGLIAGASLFVLYQGISSLIESGTLGKIFGGG
ncbi:MAG TPA: OPT/YSL family transporter [Kofleriaceae bacterium]|nr:OPT/YSL family transporter [Kofleriaceae bacterium]